MTHQFLPPTGNCDIKKYRIEKERKAGERISSWVKSPNFSVSPASRSSDKLIGSMNPCQDGGLVGRPVLPDLRRRWRNGQSLGRH
jgi:hypothetical protein